MNSPTSLGTSMITGLFDTDPNSPINVKKRAPFELRVGSLLDYELEVVSFHGRERVNDVYCYEVTFATAVDEDTLHTSLFGEPACLTIKAPGYDPRVIQGLAVSLEGLGGVPGEQKTGRRRYRTEIVPKLWLLKRRRKNRVFQQQSAPDIVRGILTEIGMTPSESQWRVIEEQYPPLPFIYQRDESDFSFVRRVLADAGIFFYFEHAGALLTTLGPSTAGSASPGDPPPANATTVLNFASRASNTPSVSPTDTIASDTLDFDDGMGAAPDDDRVYEFGLKKRLRARAIRMHERDVEGATNWVAAQAASPAPTANGPGVRFDLDTASVPTALLREERYQVDAGLPLGQNPNAVDNPRMDLELARARRRFIEADGKSDCRRLGAGYRFTLAGHPIRALNDEYTVVEMDATGTHPDNAKDASEVYRNRFRCIPSTYAPLPRRPKKRPKLGIEVAQVIAYSDIREVPWLESSPNGYVKVRFRWDIVDENGASTGMLQNGASHPSGTEDDVAVWVPVVQPWAGAGYGAQFIPREGMEVLVGFLEHQGQRPVILGCLYSAANPPPWPAQSDQQKVGIKSQTRAANGGWSEVSIDDCQANEVFTIRAQKDFVETVLNDAMVSVGNDENVTIAHDRSLQVGNNDTHSVIGDATRIVSGADTLTVTGDSTTTVTGSVSLVVSGDIDETVSGDVTRAYAGDVDAATSGNTGLRFTGDYTERHLGHRTIIVGAGATGGANPNRSAALHVEGMGSAYASTVFELEALQGFTLSCGKSQILVSPDGITLSSPNISLVGTEVDLVTGTLKATVSGDLVTTAKTTTLQTAGAKVAMDSSSATVSGSQVKFASGSGSSPNSTSQSTTITTIQMKDAQGNPRSNARVLLSSAGAERMTVLDANGMLELIGDTAYQISFPDDPVVG